MITLIFTADENILNYSLKLTEGCTYFKVCEIPYFIIFQVKRYLEGILFSILRLIKKSGSIVKKFTF